MAFLVYLAGINIPSNTSDREIAKVAPVNKLKEQADKLRNPDSAKDSSEKEEAANKPRFEFYTRLPELKVEGTPDPEPQQAPSSLEKNYVLQVGSFKSMEDADRLKAELILQGLDVNIQNAKDSKGQSWHRVQVGPYSTRSRLNKAQDVLANNEIESILMEHKP